MLVTILALTLSSFAQSRPIAPLILVERPMDVFIPDGFDDNDTIEVVLAGVFPDTKFHTGPLEMKIEGKDIFIESKVSIDQDGMSIPVLNEYMRVVRFDQFKVETLSADDYRVFVKERVSKEEKEDKFVYRGKLKVKGAKNSLRKDDFDYATIENITFDPRTKSVARLMYSTGSTCLILDPEFNPTPTVATPQIVVVQPVMRKIAPPAGKECEKTNEPHELDISLVGHFGRVLIHARSGNGDAVNKVVDLGK